ncbi:hypothetical protein B566_EDAN008969 [Ephemera danica]|nr:hypothetical protein B566_EDAN008969 [Ephemera danica]
MDNFYSRCLLCTCTPNVTQNLHIFSEAGCQMKLAEKINKYLNIQIKAELPQNVCHRCVEKLEVTHELSIDSPIILAYETSNESLEEETRSPDVIQIIPDSDVESLASAGGCYGQANEAFLLSG